MCEGENHDRNVSIGYFTTMRFH